MPPESSPPKTGDNTTDSTSNDSLQPQDVQLNNRYAQPPPISNNSATNSNSGWQESQTVGQYDSEKGADSNYNTSENKRFAGQGSSNTKTEVLDDIAPAVPSTKKDESSQAPSMSAGEALALGQKSIGSLDAKPRAKLSRPPVQPQERPGLGTSWGENHYSAVSEVAFVRDSSRPNYNATIYYNDVQGASASTGYNTSRYSTSAQVGLGLALTISLRDEYGNTLSAYRGRGRTVAIGHHGQRYVIVVQNNTNERFEVVVSVDGLDVIDGRAAGYNKRGYLVEGYGTVEIEGFRRSDDTVAAFRFGSVSNSYAAQTGSARNVGIIGAVAFGEYGYMARLRAYQDRMRAWSWQNNEVNRRMNADPFPNKYATPPLHLAY
ncbi:MAG: hypothetical protein JW841_00705 [Deltaproteobacteria bacterium]|nr:hypothetical protein [Deltaproteobacteria bacterium]